MENNKWRHRQYVDLQKNSLSCSLIKSPTFISWFSRSQKNYIFNVFPLRLLTLMLSSCRTRTKEETKKILKDTRHQFDKINDVKSAYSYLFSETYRTYFAEEINTVLR